MTATKATKDSKPQWHTIEFFTDDQLDSALTIFNATCRYHIIASKKKLGTNTKVGKEYDRLARGLPIDDEASDAIKTASPDTFSSDSGVDVREGEDGTPSDDSDQTEEPTPLSGEGALKAWMVAPLANPPNSALSASEAQALSTVEEWYHCRTRFYELEQSNGGQKVEAVELEATPELEQRTERLLPNMILPKYLTNSLTAPWFRSSELEVLECSDKPVGTPYHPCRVQSHKAKETYFLKIVDNDQPQPIKRELDILHRVEKLGLRDSMHVPQLLGLVAFDNAEPTKNGQKRIMGFLLTDIKEPTPLTLMFDESVEQERREAWAAEADRIRDVLHEHNIIWGDAKADNFLVDAQDKLWIIDFGGSYTEGWVDPELNETEEGDDLGTEKIINALKDPVANVERPEEEEGEKNEEDEEKRDQRTLAPSQSESKRKRDESGDNEEDEELLPADKRSRLEVEE
ncbi:uncharacterized protein LTR77_005214 [Saxophila tyrrhenica]|uniref:Protein kinase domain-containing protein n=1 Tax=Saxophila tyrrhenica TaxID=1690608 RepID=A0AAV9PFL8_9PEZI|nr:hypothetical protein LTR77_005214 [Saxophila tyrrhenica]